MLLRKRRLAGFTLETTKGTAATVSAPNAYSYIYDPSIVPGDFYSGGERNPASGSSGRKAPTIGMRPGTMTFTLDISHTSVFFTVMQACGFELTGDVLSPTVTPSEQKTITAVVWEDGRRKSIRGASGTCTIAVDSSTNRLVASFTLTGIWIPPVDASLPSNPATLEDGYIFNGSTVELASAAVPYIDSLGIDIGADVQPREDANDSSGIAHYYVADVNPTITLPTEAQLVADLDTFGKLLAGTEEAFAFTVADAATNELAITAPKAMRMNVGDDDRTGKGVDGLTLGCYVNSSNDQLVLTKTDAA